MKKQINTSAIDIIKAGHATIERLFDKYSYVDEPNKKEEIVQTISSVIHTHGDLEKGLFYPAASKAIGDLSLIRKAMQWHEQMNLVLDKLGRIYADKDEQEYDENVIKLRNCFMNHVKEDDKIISKIKNSNLDLFELGSKLAEHETQLKSTPIELIGKNSPLSMIGTKNIIQSGPRPESGFDYYLSSNS